MEATQTITIRRATAEDEAALERLAQLEGTRLPSGELLVAAVDGELWATVELGRSSVIADPFRASGAAAELLSLRSRRLRELDDPPRWRRPLARVRASAHRV